MSSESLKKNFIQKVFLAPLSSHISSSHPMDAFTPSISENGRDNWTSVSVLENKARALDMD